MSLNIFVKNKYRVVQHTEEHAAFMEYLRLAYEDVYGHANATVLTTHGREDLEIAVVAEPTLTDLDPVTKILHLGASEISFSVQLSKELADDPNVDVAGYVMMTFGRCFGNYIRAEALDHEGELFVRFADDATVTIERLAPDDRGAAGGILHGFQATMYLAVGRASQAV